MHESTSAEQHCSAHAPPQVARRPVRTDRVQPSPLFSHLQCATACQGTRSTSRCCCAAAQQVRLPHSALFKFASGRWFLGGMLPRRFLFFCSISDSLPSERQSRRHDHSIVPGTSYPVIPNRIMFAALMIPMTPVVGASLAAGWQDDSAGFANIYGSKGDEQSLASIKVPHVPGLTHADSHGE